MYKRQGKEITLENLSPVFTPEQEAAKRRELEQQLYEAVSYTHLGTRLCSQSVVCYTLCRRCRENAVAAGEGKGI